MSSELDLRGLNQAHEPDPDFVDALERRLEAIIITDGTASTVDAPAIEDEAVLDLYPSTAETRPAVGRWIIRAALGVAAAVVLVAVIGKIVRRDEQQVPIEPPTTTTGDGWTPERTRAEGSPVDFLGGPGDPSPTGLDAQLYCIGQAIPTGSPCDRYHPYHPYEDQHWALEVTQGGQSALFEVQGTPAVSYFDEDSILVQDGTDQSARFRLLQADGTAVDLRMVSDLAPAIPGPDVVIIEDLGLYRQWSSGPDDPYPRPYLVDDRAGTLQLLDVPAEIAWWGPNVDEFLWGGNGCRVIWQQPDGSFDHHDVCRNPLVGYTDPGWNWPGVADWLAPGRMVLVEWGDGGGGPLIVHASLDRGTTWDRIEIEDRDGLAGQDDAFDEALGSLG